MTSLPDHSGKAAAAIDELAVQVKDLVAGRKLVTIHAMPMQNSSPGFVVFLGQEDMNASEFCDLAVTTGAKILYVQTNTFDAEAELTFSLRRTRGWQSSEENPGLVTLRREASAYNGRIGQIQLVRQRQFVMVRVR